MVAWAYGGDKVPFRGTFHPFGGAVDIVEVMRPGVTLPHPDRAARTAWLAAVHDAMRGAGGAVVGAAEDPVVGRNYYRVEVRTRDGAAAVMLFNAAANLVAAADSYEIDMVFVAVPGREVFAERGFQVAGPAELDEPVTERHLRALSAYERRDVAYHDPVRLGVLLFNWFD